MNKRHFRTKSRRRIAIEAELMGKAEFFHEGRGVFLTIPLSMMERTGADENDLDDISSLAGIIEGVDCGAVLRELRPGEWKLSLRTGASGSNVTAGNGILHAHRGQRQDKRHPCLRPPGRRRSRHGGGRFPERHAGAGEMQGFGRDRANQAELMKIELSYGAGCGKMKT